MRGENYYTQRNKEKYKNPDMKIQQKEERKILLNIFESKMIMMMKT